MVNNLLGGTNGKEFARWHQQNAIREFRCIEKDTGVHGCTRWNC